MRRMSSIPRFSQVRGRCRPSTAPMVCAGRRVLTWWEVTSAQMYEVLATTSSSDIKVTEMPKLLLLLQLFNHHIIIEVIAIASTYDKLDNYR